VVFAEKPWPARRIFLRRYELSDLWPRVKKQPIAKSVQEVSKHASHPVRRFARKSFSLRHAPGRARTCNPMIRSHILYPFLGLMVAPLRTAERNLTPIRAAFQTAAWLSMNESIDSLSMRRTPRCAPFCDLTHIDRILPSESNS
jgi:hypothetical protein